MRVSSVDSGTSKPHLTHESFRERKLFLAATIEPHSGHVRKASLTGTKSLRQAGHVTRVRR